jgi:hypothetical protein
MPELLSFLPLDIKLKFLYNMSLPARLYLIKYFKLMQRQGYFKVCNIETYQSLTADKFISKKDFKVFEDKSDNFSLLTLTRNPRNGDVYVAGNFSKIKFLQNDEKESSVFKTKGEVLLS